MNSKFNFESGQNNLAGMNGLKINSNGSALKFFKPVPPCCNEQDPISTDPF
jgi:hypothetical protein